MFEISELVKITSGLLAARKEVRGGIIKGISIDSREIESGQAFVAIKGENTNGHKFIRNAVKKGASCVIANKDYPHGLRVPVIRVKDTIVALGELARYNRERYAVPVIAVTGSNGKTTTKEMIAAALSADYKVLKNEGTKNNHIGLPLTLLKLDNSYDAAVVELGTNHFGEIAYLSKIALPNIGVITNIGPSHLEGFKSLSGVLKEKWELICNLSAPRIAVLNADDPHLRKKLLSMRKEAFCIGAGVCRKADFSAFSLKERNGRYSYEIRPRLRIALGVLGYYNIHNSLLALAVSRVLGVSYRNILLGLSGFSLPRGRLSHIEVKGFKFIDDTYNSNPLSLSQALSYFRQAGVRGRRIAVIGDMLELGKESVKYHTQAFKSALEFCDHVIAVGKISNSSIRALKAHKGKLSGCGDASRAREILLNDLDLSSSDLVLVKGSRGMKMEQVFKI